MKTENLRTGTSDLEIQDGEDVDVLRGPDYNSKLVSRGCSVQPCPPETQMKAIQNEGDTMKAM